LDRGIAERAQSSSIYREFSWSRHANVSAKVQDCIAEPPCLNSWGFLGETWIAAWIEPPASLPERGAEHSQERGPLHPKIDQQSSHLDGQICVIERSQAPRGPRQRLRRRRTRLATNRVQSRLRRIAADDLGTELTFALASNRVVDCVKQKRDRRRLFSAATRQPRRRDFTRAAREGRHRVGEISLVPAFAHARLSGVNSPMRIWASALNSPLGYFSRYAWINVGLSLSRTDSQNDNSISR
jgi:hypothetical protein